MGGDVGEGLGPVLLDPGRSPAAGGERGLALGRRTRRRGRRRGGVDVHGSGGGGSRHGGAETLVLAGGIGGGWLAPIRNPLALGRLGDLASECEVGLSEWSDVSARRAAAVG